MGRRADKPVPQSAAGRRKAAAESPKKPTSQLGNYRTPVLPSAGGIRARVNASHLSGNAAVHKRISSGISREAGGGSRHGSKDSKSRQRDAVAAKPTAHQYANPYYVKRAKVDIAPGGSGPKPTAAAGALPSQRVRNNPGGASRAGAAGGRQVRPGEQFRQAGPDGLSSNQMARAA